MIVDMPPPLPTPSSLVTPASAAPVNAQALANAILRAGTPVYAPLADASAYGASQRDQLVEQLVEFSKFGEGWDGYGALQPTYEAILFSKHIIALLAGLPALGTPDLTPHSNGTIGFGWEQMDREAYLEVGRSRFAGHMRHREQVVYLEGQNEELSAALLGTIADHMSAANLRPKSRVMASYS